MTDTRSGHEQSSLSESVSPTSTVHTAKFTRMVLLPGTVYFIVFVVYTWPWLSQFNSRFYADDADGLQNVWNIWWVDRSVTRLHQSPFHTTLLHYPYGTTLVGQTLNPFNGFSAIPLFRILSVTQTFNTLVVFSFVAAGVTAFLLCFELSNRYAASIVGGFVFTFSAYHLASATGLMQLVSLEWIPLFLLLWWRLLTRPRYTTAGWAALAILLVLWSDYYYFLYSVTAAVLIAIYLFATRVAHASRPLLVFAALFLALCGPLPLQLLRYNQHDALLGAHNPQTFSADLGTTVIDGGRWRFAALTDWYWRHIGGFSSGTTVYLGVVVLGVFVVAAMKRRRLHRDALFWLMLAAVFWMLSLGPRLIVEGHRYEHIPLPYALVARVVPPLRLGGTPYRLTVVVTIAAAILTSFVLGRIDLHRRRGQLAFTAIVVVLFLEMWPATLPATPARHPGYVDALKALPAGAVFDAAAPTASWQLYYQTVHGRPIALGYISRIPATVETRDLLLVADAKQSLELLCTRDHIRYYAARSGDVVPAGNVSVAYRDPDVVIYDLGTSAPC